MVRFEKSICTKPIWVINSALFFVQVLILYFQVDKIIQVMQKDQSNLLKSQQSFIEKRKKHIRNLWIVMYSYLVIVSVTLLYDTVNYMMVNVFSAYMSEEYKKSLQPCTQVSGNFHVDATIWFFYFWIGWIAWCYPFLYVVWPRKKQEIDMN